jgi:hypothetical protein
MVYGAKIVKILRGYQSQNKQLGTNSSETRTIIGIGSEEPYQHL